MSFWLVQPVTLAYQQHMQSPLERILRISNNYAISSDNLQITKSVVCPIHY